MLLCVVPGMESFEEMPSAGLAKHTQHMLLNSRHLTRSQMYVEVEAWSKLLAGLAGNQSGFWRLDAGPEIVCNHKLQGRIVSAEHLLYSTLPTLPPLLYSTPLYSVN